MKIFSIIVSIIVGGLFCSCQSAPTQRSTATLPPIDKGAMQPYAENVTAPEPEVYQPEREVLSTIDSGLSTDERIVELIATADPTVDERSMVTNHVVTSVGSFDVTQPDPAPTDVRRKKDNVRQTRPRHMNKAQWEATKEQP